MKKLLGLLVLCSTIAQANIRTLTEDVVQELQTIEKGQELDLVAKVVKKYAEKVAQQVGHKSNINVHGPHKETALMIAAKAGLADIVEILLAYKADVTLEDEDGFTAMMHLVKRWVTVDGTASYIVRFIPVDSELVDPEKCLGLLLDAGAEYFERALINVKHADVKKAEQEHKGLSRLVVKIKNLPGRTTRRIQMRRLRKEQENA